MWFHVFAILILCLFCVHVSNLYQIKYSKSKSKSNYRHIFSHCLSCWASEARTLFFELLGSQMTHWNEPILYRKVLSWGLQKVQDHFGELSESWADHDQNRSILSRKMPNFRGGKNRDLKNSYFIFYKFNQGPVFCKHPNF